MIAARAAQQKKAKNMLTVKVVGADDERLYEGDKITRIHPGSRSVAAPGVIVTMEGELVSHIRFADEIEPDASAPAHVVYVMNSNGATVAIYHPQPVARSVGDEE